MHSRDILQQSLPSQSVREVGGQAAVRRAVLGRAVLGLVGLGAGLLGYAVGVERQAFALRRFDVPVLAPGSRPVRLLHIADPHTTARQRRKIAWLRGLAALQPDLVISTGDNVGGAEESFAATLEAHEPLLTFPGAFVWGNNDHFAPVPKSPSRYITRSTAERRGARIDLTELGAAYRAAGWLDLNNARAVLNVAGSRIALGGIDDSHTHHAQYERIAGVADPSAAVRIGVMHVPDAESLDDFTDDGYDLLLAGHTHGGQVRLPGIGALVTNCDLDRSRARWLSRWTSRRTGRSAYLHVSAGLGTNKYAPIRFGCRPEATLLTLLSR